MRSIPKETCHKVTRFDEPYKNACFWGVNETSKDGHVYHLGFEACAHLWSSCKLHVFRTSYGMTRMWLLATPQGACSARKSCCCPSKTCNYMQRVDCDAARGLQCPKETCKIATGRKSIGESFTLSNHDDARDGLFHIFPSGKTGTRRREHRVYWVPSLICLLGSHL